MLSAFFLPKLSFMCRSTIIINNRNTKKWIQYKAFTKY
jgi:hypothetical protein